MTRPVTVRSTLMERQDGRFVATVYRDEHGLSHIHTNRRSAVAWIQARVGEEYMAHHDDGSDAA